MNKVYNNNNILAVQFSVSDNIFLSEDLLGYFEPK